MDENNSDFDALLVGTSAEEAKRLWRALSEWCKGDENSFPVLLALLTRAQWRAAGRIPLLINDSVKLMELKLADYRQQTGALVKDFARTADAKANDLKTVVTAQTDAMNQALAKAEMRLNDAESVADQIKRQLESGAEEWKKARSDFEAERLKLEQTRKEMEKHLNRRDWMVFLLIIVGLIGIGIGIGVVIAHH